MSRSAVASPDAPKALGPYSQAQVVLSGPLRLVHTSGQVGLDPKKNEIVEGGVAAETRQVLANLEAVLAASGCTFADVVKTTVFLTDMADFAEMNAAYAQAFGEHRPARSTVCLLYTSPSPRDISGSRMPSSA